MLNTKLAKKYARHALAKKKLEEKAKEIGNKLDHWSQPLIDHMQDEGLDKLSLHGGITLSLKEMIWAKIVAKTETGEIDKHRAVQALREAGLEEYITEEGYNSHSLSAYLRELVRGQEPLPKEFRNVIVKNPKTNIIVKKL